MKLRTIALGLALLAGAAGAAAAQESQGQTQQQGARRTMAMSASPLFEGMQLSAEQKAKVDSIQAAHMPKMQALREEIRAARESGGDVQAPMQKARAANDEMLAAVKALLTADQQATFDKNRAAGEARRRQMMQNRGGPPSA